MSKRNVRESRWSRVAMAVAVAAPAAVCSGQGAAPKPAASPPPEPARAPEGAAARDAKAVLDRLSAHAAALKAVSVKVKMINTMTMEGEEQTHEQAMMIVAERPNKVSLREAGDDAGQFAMVSDGQTFWQYIGGPFNKYAADTAPAGFGPVADAMNFGAPADMAQELMSPPVFVLLLLDQERFEALRQRMKAEHVGKERLEGRECDRIRLTSGKVKADVWVRSGEEAWLEKMTPDMAGMYEDIPGLPEDFLDRMPKMETMFTEWTATPELDAKTFAFAPPEGAEKVDSLADAFGGEGGGPGDEEPEPGHAALLGAPAPDVALDMVDGGKMTIAQHRGKEIVVLDFWATWCPPCVRGLPLVAKAAESFKDKGVVFYAVNQQESVETVKKFLEKRELKVKVPMDAKREAAKAYGVSGIPQTVIIGKDGTVQAIHVGFAPGMEDQLAEEIQKLLDGKKLAGGEGKGR